jgi:hypothetical protein
MSLIVKFKKRIPWWAKIGGKLLLRNFPLDYRFLNRFNITKYGHMVDPAYAFRVYQKHYLRANPPEGFVSLELGPGDSLTSALLTRAFGGSKSYLVDTGDFVTRDMTAYFKIITFLNQKGFFIPELKSVEEILDYCNASYLTSGLLSLKQVPNNSVDFIWSQAVLEHVRKHDFSLMLQELHRISKNLAIGSHVVDLKDHLSNALNHLRFSERVWESDCMVTPSFYTNRIGYKEMLRLFQEAGFATEVASINRWDRLPTPRAKLSPEFAQIPDEDLCISDFSIIVRAIKG